MQSSHIQAERDRYTINLLARSSVELLVAGIMAVPLDSMPSFTVSITAGTMYNHCYVRRYHLCRSLQRMQITEVK